MTWNWEQNDWPNFQYDSSIIRGREDQFLKKTGLFLGIYTHIRPEDKDSIIIELMSDEAIKTSEIEGEYLNRDSVQSSLRQNLGFQTDNRKNPAPESGIAEMMVDLYQNIPRPLSHEILWNWHKMLMKGRKDLKNIGSYRTHLEPMQVVSGYIHAPKVHFEAPPSVNVTKEMNQFLKWFNKTAPDSIDPIPALTRASIAHLYFVSIHPFEDGNGRIGRQLAEMALAQSLRKPTLITLSHTIQNNKRTYYAMLEKSNKDIEITPWLLYFCDTILEAQDNTINIVEFMVEKTKFYDKIRGQLNQRQEKALARIFKEGPDGFKGGLSAEKYISITGASRATATRDLQDLVEKRALISTGQLKKTRYLLNINSSKERESI